MTLIELVAALLGLANLVLIIRRSVWNYPFALAMVTLYAKVFWDAKLYSDAGLQLFFIAANLYGWWAWSRASAAVGEVRVEQLTPRARLIWLGATFAAALGWGWLMATRTDASYPYADALVLMGSVAAQILMTRRYLENWHGWIGVNLVSIALYAAKGLYPTMILYLLFLGMAIAGLIEWRRAART